MTNRENALEIIRFGKPERIMRSIPEYSLAYLGCDHEGYDGKGDECPAGSRWKDIWGTVWHKEKDDYMGLPEQYPLDEPQKLAQYKWPNPQDERIIGRIYQQREKFDPNSDCFLHAHHRDTLWEKAYMLVGMENIMIYLYEEPDYAKEIFGRIMDFQLEIAKTYIANGAEVVQLSDDLGTQRSLLMSRDIIKEFLMPEYRRLIDLYKRNNVIIEFHSCGQIQDILDLFIELGIDVLNPIQASANDLRLVRERTNGKLCLRGGVSTQVMLEGSAEQIEAEVKSKIELLGANGGYFCSPDQSMNWPLKSSEAFRKALEKWGKYKSC